MNAQPNLATLSARRRPILGRSVNIMYLVGLPLLLLLPLQLWAGDWKIRWEAAKGDLECTIPYQPRPLDEFLCALPSGHLEANADIKSGLVPASSTLELLGRFRGRKIFSLELHVAKTYYTRYFLILAEVEAGQYMPIYVHQFAPGAHGHGKPVFKAEEGSFSVLVSSDTHGTGPSSESFLITCDLKSPPKTEQVDAVSPAKPGG